MTDDNWDSGKPIARTAFDTALCQLVETHHNELQKLQAEIMRLRDTSGSKGSSIPTESTLPHTPRLDAIGVSIDRHVVVTPREETQSDLGSKQLAEQFLLADHGRSIEHAASSCDGCSLPDLDKDFDQPPYIMSEASQTGKGPCKRSVNSSWGFNDIFAEDNGDDDGRRESMITALQCLQDKKQETSDYFKKRSVWAYSPDERVNAQINDISNTRVNQKFTWNDSFTTTKVFTLSGKTFCQAMHPSSFWKMVWDLCAAVVLCYDLLTMPMQAFHPKESLPLVIMTWVTQLFWNADILISFHTGYWEKGVVVRRHGKIAKHYMRTWLLFDLLVVGVDWCVFIVQKSSSSGGNVKAGRILRAVKLLRLLRIFKTLKFFEVFHLLEEFLDEGEMLSIHLGMCKCIVLILVYCHFIACGWFGVGDDREGRGWVSTYNFSNEDFWYRYIRSVHWSVTQLGVGSPDIAAGNLREHAYSIAVLLVNLLVFSVLVSSITNSLSTIQVQQEDRKRDWSKLRRFCDQNGITRNLVIRITHYLQHKQSMGREIQTSQVRLLDDLSAPLRAEFMFQVHRPCFKVHSLFDSLCTSSPKVMHTISDKALSVTSFASQDAVFGAGHVSNHCYFGISGVFVYQHINTPVPDTIEAGCWMAEQTLWTHWIHMGDLRASLESELLVINAQSFCDIISGHTVEWKVVCHYADLVMESFKTLGVTELSDVKLVEVDDTLFPRSENQYKSRQEIGKRTFQSIVGTLWPLLGRKSARNSVS